MEFSQQIHPELINKIQELVCIGTAEPTEMLNHYYMYAEQFPDPNDRAYYPFFEDIWNHINKAKKAMLYSVVDQENALKMMEQWQKDSPNSLYKFRLYKSKSVKWKLHQETLAILFTGSHGNNS